MSNFYVDISALLKRYVSENGSRWVVSWIIPGAGNVIAISELLVIEVFSAFARRLRDGSLSVASVTTLKNNFLLHVEKEYLVIEIDRNIISDARDLVTKYPHVHFEH